MRVGWIEEKLKLIKTLREYTNCILIPGKRLRKNEREIRICTVCPRSSAPFYIVSNYVKWVTTS